MSAPANAVWRSDHAPTKKSLAAVLPATTREPIRFPARTSRPKITHGDSAAREKLGEVIESARRFGDLAAERIVKPGVAADGRVDTIAAGTDLAEFPLGFRKTGASLAAVTDRLDTVVTNVHLTIADRDPATAYLCVEITRGLETHL